VLGRCRAATRTLGDAQTNLSEAQKILSKADNAKKGDREKALTGLVELHDAWHGAEPAAGHDVKAAEWRAKLAESQAAAEEE
jgi:hypothetical protein